MRNKLKIQWLCKDTCHLICRTWWTTKNLKLYVILILADQCGLDKPQGKVRLVEADKQLWKLKQSVLQVVNCKASPLLVHRKRLKMRSDNNSLVPSQGCKVFRLVCKVMVRWVKPLALWVSLVVNSLALKKKLLVCKIKWVKNNKPLSKAKLIRLSKITLLLSSIR